MKLLGRIACALKFHDWYNGDPNPGYHGHPGDLDKISDWLHRPVLYICRRCRERRS